MLRYLVLLAEGGVYSDADTRALMPLAHWADDAELWVPPLSRSPISVHTAAGPASFNSEGRTAEREPVRMIISVEGDFHIWRDKVGL